MVVNIYKINKGELIIVKNDCINSYYLINLKMKKCSPVVIIKPINGIAAPLAR